MEPPATPQDLTLVTASDYGDLIVFSPSGYQCSRVEYAKAMDQVVLWNPLEALNYPNKLVGLTERYLRTGDPHEEPEDPFGMDGQGFIDEW